MYSQNYSLSGLKAEDIQNPTPYIHQEKDYWTMRADEFFAELEESNSKSHLPSGFVLKPIQYDMEHKCRIVTIVKA